MIILSYFLLAVAIFTFIIIWKKDNNLSFVISPFLIFSVYDLMGVYTCIHAYQNGLCDSLIPFWVYLSSFFAFSISYYLHKHSIQLRHSSIVVYKNREFEDNDYDRYYIPLIFLMICLVGVGLFLYKGIPLSIKNMLSLFKGDLSYSDAVSLTEYRRAMTKSYYFGGSYTGSGLLRYVLRYGWEFVDVMGLVILVKDKKHRQRNRITFFVGIILSYIFVTGDGTRVNIFRVFLAVIVAFTLLKKVKMGTAIKIGVLAMALLIVVSSVSLKIYSEEWNIATIKQAANSIIDRTVSGNQINDVYVIDWYEKGIMEHYYGQQHWIQIVNSLPGASSYKSFSYVISQVYGANSSTTYMTPTYLSILYADFGFLGTILGYYAIGFVIPFIENYIYRKKKNCFWFTVASILIMDIGLLIMTGLVKIIPELVVIVFICLLYKFFMDFRLRLSGRKPIDE